MAFCSDQAVCVWKIWERMITSETDLGTYKGFPQRCQEHIYFLLNQLLLLK